MTHARGLGLAALFGIAIASCAGGDTIEGDGFALDTSPRVLQSPSWTPRPRW